MNRWHLVACITALGAMMLVQIGAALSQTSDGQYQPAVPSSTTVTNVGAYPYSYGGGTVAGSTMQGMASVISARGDYNLSTSAAAINWTQAQRNEIQNRQAFQETYYQMRATNRAYQEAEAAPKLTQEQLARLARDAAPKPLSPGDMNPVSGAIVWPSALQQPSFEGQRAELDRLSAMQASHGALSTADQMAARKSIEAMFAELKTQIKDLPSQDYLASRNFLRSLVYTMASSHL